MSVLGDTGEIYFRPYNWSDVLVYARECLNPAFNESVVFPYEG